MLAAWNLQEPSPLAPGAKPRVVKSPNNERAKPRNFRQRSIVTSFVFEGNLEISAGDGGSLSETTSYLSSQAATLLCKQGPDCDLECVALGN
jgi:hypothetical protein